MMETAAPGDTSSCTPVVTEVGAVNAPGARRVRIVHISDTHGRHDAFLADIPPGDILVHSGDFGCYAFPKFFRPNHHFNIEVQAINDFFAKVPHKHVVFVSGNHELHFPTKTQEATQSLLTRCHYLQDSAVTLEGVKFYGAPWSGKRLLSLARAFSVDYGRKLGEHWDEIPADVDVVVTHTPVSGVLDLSIDRSIVKDRGTCNTCGESHPGWCHWGCPYLRTVLIDRVKPKLHLFGHCHERNGITKEEGIVFSNAAMKINPHTNVFDFYIPTSGNGPAEST